MTGAVSGLVVIDIEVPDGIGSVARILSDPPLLPTVKTEKGYHHYGRHPGNSLKNFEGLYPGLRGRADADYVVAPSPRHGNDQNYRWTRPLEERLPELSQGLCALFTSPGKEQDVSAPPISKLETTLSAGRLDFVTVATAADGKLMTKVFFIDSEGASRPAATTRAISSTSRRQRSTVSMIWPAC